MTKSWNKNPKCTRTKEGLIAHHKYEDHAILLADPKHAKSNPYEWQLPANIVYCDYLEHLYLHILICENPSPDHNLYEVVGVEGVINFIVPELNDVYSGFVTEQPWRMTCHNLIKNDKDVYMLLLKRFKANCYDNHFYSDDCLQVLMHHMENGLKKIIENYLMRLKNYSLLHKLKIKWLQHLLFVNCEY